MKKIAFVVCVLALTGMNLVFAQQKNIDLLSQRAYSPLGIYVECISYGKLSKPSTPASAPILKNSRKMGYNIGLEWTFYREKPLFFVINAELQNKPWLRGFSDISDSEIKNADIKHHWGYAFGMGMGYKFNPTKKNNRLFLKGVAGVDCVAPNATATSWMGVLPSDATKNVSMKLTDADVDFYSNIKLSLGISYIFNFAIVDCDLLYSFCGAYLLKGKFTYNNFSSVVMPGYVEQPGSYFGLRIKVSPKIYCKSATK